MHCSTCLDDIRHPLGQLLNKDGLCTGCVTHAEKNSINWDHKWQELDLRCKEILKTPRKGTYDCIIPLNADAEDYYIVELALKLKLKPLLVFVNNYFGTDISWRNIHNLSTQSDLDLQIFNPEFISYKEAVRSSLRKFNSIFWPYQALKTAYPVRMAIDLKIPLILWGGLQATEQVGKFSHYDRVEMSGWNRVQHDLLSIDEKNFFGTGVQLTEKKQYAYFYPQLKEAKKVIGLYMSNYVRWDPWKQNNDMLKYGFLPEENLYTFDKFERAGSSVFYDFHDLLRFENHGYRKVRDHLSREIRHGRITLSNARLLYKQYEGQQFDIEPFFLWLGATKSGIKLFSNNRLSKNQNLIGTNKSIINPKEMIKEGFFPDAMSSTQKFLTYYKGI